MLRWLAHIHTTMKMWAIILLININGNTLKPYMRKNTIVNANDAGTTNSLPLFLSLSVSLVRDKAQFTIYVALFILEQGHDYSSELEQQGDVI